MGCLLLIYYVFMCQKALRPTDDSIPSSPHTPIRSHSVDELGNVNLWPASEASRSGFGWFHPRATWVLPRQLRTYKARCGESVNMYGCSQVWIDACTKGFLWNAVSRPHCLS